jgi:lipopolysaccharide/colanic/teichoic acid biosynthesis glycosyltransferase
MTATGSDVAGGTTSESPAGTAAHIVSPSWRRALPAVVGSADFVAAVAAVLLALRLGIRDELSDLRVTGSTVGYLPAALAVAVAWPGVLSSLGAYRSAVVGSGPDEMGRVVEAGLTLFAALAAVHLLLDTNLSGRLVALVVGLLVLATLMVRVVADLVVRRARRHDRWRHRAVVYGAVAEASSLTQQFSHQPALGVDVVGLCVTDVTDIPGPRPGGNGDGGENSGAADAGGGNGAATLPAGSIGAFGDVALDVMSSTGADMLAVAGGTSPAEVRALAWALEGTGAELLIAPAVPDLAQQRVIVEPIGGVVLLRVEECRQRRGRLLIKATIDRVIAALLLVVLAPLFVAVALAVKLTSPGPTLYRQPRIGQYGSTFEFFKFRTMVVGAEVRLDELADRNESNGPLFKVHQDPRVTDLGRFLRRMSLDELPQLWNVVRGDMSLVGPRPLPVGSDVFVGDERRRLRVKPGITGLWQVSGRSDLTWEETVALDMRYVDHWSLGLDLAIMIRTPLTVLLGRGAY